MLLFWQAGDVAFSVPNSLVVTLERVLGNEIVGESLYRYIFSHFFFLVILLIFMNIWRMHFLEINDLMDIPSFW